MGLPFLQQQDAAPAYDDVVHDHPVNQFPPSGSNSAYAAVPQDDVELHAHTANQPTASPGPAQEPETLAQTIAGVFRPKPHVHCEQCDVQLQARERRENERHCCFMVAATFMTAFFCMMILGIVVAKTMKHHD
ncbi:hypothetical protein BU24DRAFT_459487 [Aaosphaeria arxii CBS 175.79]|uniref:LITAF domain-containing protein n=1 Tax=Aaosphaeria arxii CBS 175.79 TaxID=1450172 RepID=A0A6A5Y4Z6_9PLEO|nr:uncharacterized protein BU24DRAFT_459487 [Aaosphaeria arxii CBS 175.79]KAF2019860.1 hypothetical protein BU24DRAFT_459487 [Aaosphaeria arxii CBS 175.79]